jgi:acyl dehydratase
VRPGDELTIRITILEKRDSGSRPLVGIVRFNLEMLNARNEPVMLSSYSGFFGKRNPEAA